MKKPHHYDECPLCMAGDICKDSTAAELMTDPPSVLFVLRIVAAIRAVLK